MPVKEDAKVIIGVIVLFCSRSKKNQKNLWFWKVFRESASVQEYRLAPGTGDRMEDRIHVIGTTAQNQGSRVPFGSSRSNDVCYLSPELVEG